LQIQQTTKRQIEKRRGFFKWCTSWSGNLYIENSYGNVNIFKNALSQKGLEYF
jgi:hypothetical protein